jgi:hypothetical protein
MTGLKIKRESNKMFAKNKVSQSMIDAVNQVIGETKEENAQQILLDEAAEKVPTPTGMRVYGTSYGNSAKARKDQTKAAVDTLKGPKDKELLKDDEIDETGFHKAAHGAKRAGQSHFEFQGKKYPVTAKSHAEAVSEEGDCVTKPQAKDIAKKEVGKHEKGMHGKSGEVAKHEKKMHKEEMTFAEKLKASLKEGKATGTEEIFTDNNLGEEEMTDAQMKKREKIVMSMKKGEAGMKQRYGKNWKNVMYATATKQAMKEDSSDVYEGEELDEASPVKNQDVADKAYLKHKPGTVKGTMTQLGRFLRGKPEIKEEVIDESSVTTPEKASERDKITTDMLSGRQRGGKLNAFKNFKVDLVTSGEETIPTETDEGGDTKEKQKITTNPGPVEIKLDDKLTTPPQHYFSDKKKLNSEEVRGELKHIRNKEGKMRDKEVNNFANDHKQGGLVKNEEIDQVEEKVIAGTPGWKEMPKDVKDKSGAVHTPMSRAKDLARQSFKRIKNETMMGKISN